MDNFDIDLGAALDPQGPVVDAEFFVVPERPGELSITPVALNLVPFEREVALYKAKAASLVISDTLSLTAAVEVKSQSKILKGKLEKMRVGSRAPFLEHLKNLQNIFMMLIDPLSECEVTINKKQATYDHQLLMERRRREAEQREERDRQQKMLDDEARAQRQEAAAKAREAAEKLKTEEDAAARATLEQTIADETAAAEAPTPQAAPIVAEKPEVIRTAHGTSWTQFKWVCRIIDPDKVARQFCDPSEKKLNDFVKGGGRQADGCVIEEIPIPKTRV